MSKRLQKSLKKKSLRRRLVRYGLAVANTVVLLAAVAFVLGNARGNSATSALAASGTTAATAPIDGLTSYGIAANVAHMANLPETTAIDNQLQSAQINATVSADSTGVIAKPQIVATALKNREDIRTYVVRAGDTVASIAQKFGITTNSVKWSNGLASDTVAAGTKLVIPPITGIVYTARAGDTVQSLASKYQVSADQIVAYNDAELNGIYTGEQLLIPNGQVKAAVNSYGGGSGYSYSLYNWSPAYGGNGYVPGQCTWWAAQRRIQIGRPLPSNLGNAVSWLSGAARAGLSEGHTPKAGAVIWFVPSSRAFNGTPASLGHVGFVESVDADGTVHASDMNWGGPYRVRYFTIPPNEATQFSYIY